MLMRASDTIRSLDWVMIAAVGLLTCLGLAMLASATYTESIFSGLFIRQSIAALVSFIALLLFSFIHPGTIQRYAWILYGLGVAGLTSVAIFGTLIRGTVSRLQIFGVQVQPSEFMKVGLIAGLAWLAARFLNQPIKMVVASGLTVSFPIALVLFEPDLGAAALLAAVWLGLIFFLGLPWRYVFVILVLGTVTFGGAWQFWLADYQKDRLRTFINPTIDPLGSGYNVAQSIVALGSGQLIGRGLGHGSQSQLKFLPERHTDFIIASIGEELGFLGICLILALYAVVLWRILHLARSTLDPFTRSFSVGVFLLILVSLVVSAGMNMGLLPVTGIPLPLISYGGSHLVVTYILLGIIQSMHVHGKWTSTPPLEIEHF